MTSDRFYHVYPAHILRGHSIGAARTFARTLHGLDQICTDFARIHTDVHGRTDARTPHGRCTDISWCPYRLNARISSLLLKYAFDYEITAFLEGCNAYFI